jgi:4-diphosphocytidyl-2-C-methyl-D-erythritol kinase
MSTLLLRSPAKLNFFLKVLGKRPDHYHNLETIFERISLCDEIRLVGNRSGKIQIICSHPQVPKGPKNLVYRVARLLQTRLGIQHGVTITIKKNIPVAAGLAGGSSNAATTLLGLNQIWELGLSTKQLVDFGAQIGSDVAFFLYDTSWALGQGRGEIIRPLKIRQKLWHVVVVARMKMYSKAVFAGLNLKLTKKGADVSILTLALQKKSVFQAGDLLHNDLETSILSIAPQLSRVKERLCQYGFYGVAFSGSGPACYGLASSEKEARAAARDLRRYYSRVFVVDTL